MRQSIPLIFSAWVCVILGSSVHGATVYATSDTYKLDPVDGSIVEFGHKPPGSLASGNAVWKASQKTVVLGAAGAVEAAITALALRDGKLPPTRNLFDRDPECDLDVVTGEAREARGLRVALSNSFAFGGHNVVLALRRSRSSVSWGNCHQQSSIDHIKGGE